MTVSNSTFAANGGQCGPRPRSNSYGGAIATGMDSPSRFDKNEVLTITNSTFYHNGVQSDLYVGGAIYIGTNVRAAITNSTFFLTTLVQKIRRMDLVA